MLMFENSEHGHCSLSHRVAVKLHGPVVALPVGRPVHGAVEAAVAVVLPPALGDERVRVDALPRLAVLRRRRLPLPAGRLLRVVTLLVHLFNNFIIK